MYARVGTGTLLNVVDDCALARVSSSANCKLSRIHRNDAALSIAECLTDSQTICEPMTTAAVDDDDCPLSLSIAIDFLLLMEDRSTMSNNRTTIE
ncbi:hypothetical protein HanIR_Chr10g0473631 [Helianthus annuus]|nr:hypothetical protein HanIR_Chr10g0473631 [Helianthus annuus]